MASCLSDIESSDRADLIRCPAASGQDAPVAVRDGRAISRAALLADAEALVPAIPAGSRVVNLCVDRYNFMVGLVATLMRGEETLLPNDLSRRGLAGLAHRFDRLHCLVDRPHATGSLATQQVWWDGRGDGRDRRIPQANTDDLIVTLFTSGSTGEPVATRRTWTWMLRTTDDYYAGLGLDGLPGLSLVGTVPAQHAYGLEGSIMLPLVGDCTVSTAMPLYPRDIVDALLSVPEPRGLVTTPYHLKVLLDADVRVPELSVVLSAAAPLPRDLAARAEAAVGGSVREVYGCTEVGLIATRRTAETSTWTLPASLGIEVDGPDAIVTGAHLPEPVRLADEIEIVSKTSFCLRGRRSDLVKIAGKRTSLSGLNAALVGIDAVEDGIFVVLPNDADPTSQRLVALVVAPQDKLDDVRRAIRGVVPPPFAPRKVIRVDAIPRNATGKVLSAELTAMAQKSQSSP